MSKNITIAVAGKGGVGKTSVSALMVASLVKRGNGPVLAVDADPNATLAEGLGVRSDLTLGAIRDDILKNKDKLPPGMGKNEYVALLSHQCVIEGTGFDLVVMGRTEGPGCYCYVNTLLRGFMTDLEPNYAYTVMDNEAGMEHLSRRTARKVDVLAVVADGSLASLKAAARIADLMAELEICPGKSGLILNKGGSVHRELPGALPLFGVVPADPAVEQAEREGKPIISLPEESPARAAVAGILDRIL